MLVAAAGASWCEGLRASLAEPWPDDSAAQVSFVERALATLPVEAQGVAGQVRALLGKDAAVTDARDALVAVARDGCDAPRAHAGAPAADVQALLDTDSRFGGVRVGDDVLDRLLDRFWRWLSSFLESEGMQRYAGSARVIYLGLLGAGVAFVLLRLAQRFRTARLADDDASRADTRARVALSQVRAARDLVADAEALLASDPHAAAALLQRALLTRVGQETPAVATPARTSREVLARVDPGRRAILEYPLTLFDTVYFARPTRTDDAQGLLAAVRAAHVRLDEMTRAGAA